MSLIKKNSAKKSFTLLEMVISLGIFLLIFILILAWQKDIFSINTVLVKRLDLQNDLRKIIKSFVAEVRTGRASAAGAYVIAQAAKDEFIFFSDYDFDQTTERIRYFLDGGKIKKGIIEPAGQPPVYNPNNEVIHQLANFIINENDEIFLYYDENYTGSGNPLTQPVDPAEVRLVKIILTADEDTTRAPEAITETSQTVIRNLKDNL